MNNKIIKEINKINNNIISYNISLKNYNTMKLDCFCKYFIQPTNIIELKKVLLILSKYNIKYFIIGNGSNILLTKKEKEYVIKLNFKYKLPINVLNASELINTTCVRLYKHGYSGLESLYMIPGSIGGSIAMNAGAFGKNISDLIEYVYYLDEQLDICVISKEDCKFSYRSSIFKEKGYIVVGCKIKLIKDNPKIIKERMEYIKDKRIQNQPYEWPSSGSIFKNPINYKAWELIEFSKLKGYKKNGAMISDKHSNFIVNVNNASFQDIIFLINLIEKKVKNNFYINLEREVIILD